MTAVICHTADCLNEGIAIEMQLTFEMTDEWGETTTVTTTDVVCGPCGQPITDISDDAAPAP